MSKELEEIRQVKTERRATGIKTCTSEIHNLHGLTVSSLHRHPGTAPLVHEEQGTEYVTNSA
ncbi:putative viral baseplate protein [Salmonella phage 21]|nr:putative viral baseplate protein [Salmonella phage 21]